MSIWVASEVVAILLSFWMAITITILSYIWCTSLAILLGNFITLNLPLSQLFGCKLSTIFEISQTIPTCDVENGIERKTTTFYKSSL
jgi:ABC-type nitrate/sulfonate/bicarbonate transport system permease component